MERKEHGINSDQLVANIDEMVIMIDAYILRIKQMLASKQITLNEDRALFYAMNLMLKEKRELIEEKDRVLLDNMKKRAILRGAS